MWRVAKDEYSRAQGVVDQESGDVNNDHPEQEESPSPSNDLSLACLGFCFSLLQEQYSKNEYSNVLVCGSAVLGVRMSGARWGWMGADFRAAIYV